MMEEGASGGNPEKPAVDGGPGSEGGGAAAEPKAALTEEVNGSGAELGGMVKCKSDFGIPS